jgi:hemerythrin-like domain-containing protein
MDLFRLLKEDHKTAQDEIKRMLEEYEESKELSMDDRRHLCRMLYTHMEMEEKFLYPVLLKHKDTEEIGKLSQVEHEEAKRLVDKIMNEKVDFAHCQVSLEMLQLAIKHHVEEEEQEMFPLIKETLEQDEIERIGKEMQSYKKEKLPSKSR